MAKHKPAAKARRPALQAAPSTVPAQRQRLTSEQTNAQIVRSVSSGILFPPAHIYKMKASGIRPGSHKARYFEAYRRMRKHPTINLARNVFAGTVMSADWSFEADEDVDPDRIEFIQEEINAVKSVLLNAAVYGMIDFGFEPNEIVFEAKANKIGLNKIKPLLQDFTQILVDALTGEFKGYLQDNPFRVTLDKDYCLHFAWKVEGTDWYGQSMLAVANEIYEEWCEANYGASTYDQNVAGSRYVIQFPPGRSMFDGVEMDNSEIAALLPARLKACDTLLLPNTVAEFVDQVAAENMMWKVTVLEDKGGRQPSFIERLKYLDTLLVRAFCMPERAITEGQFGTKAEAGAHADQAILVAQQMVDYIAETVQTQLVNKLLTLNFGEDAKNTIRLVASPIVDKKLAYMQSIYTEILTNAQGFAEEYGLIDTDALKDALNIPKSKQIASPGSMLILPLPGTQPSPQGGGEQQAQQDNQGTPAPAAKVG
jgi:hypothetical protein